MKDGRRRIVVTGCNGQLALCLKERALGCGDLEIVAVGRPALDLSAQQTIAGALEGLRPDLVVSAAAYTAVDRAESDEAAAMAVNALGPAQIAGATAALGIPVVHVSTDYVFDGTKPSPYVEDDPVAPLGAYGRTKRAGELAVAAGNPDHAILRTAWLYSPFGGNFLKTMLRLAGERDSLRVVDDQIGNPTSALDLADGILTVARNLLSRREATLRGVFHMSASGRASWADFAEEIFRCARTRGAPSCTVERIPTSAYPTPAKRPANSRLDCSRLRAAHGVRLPDWRESVAAVVERLVGLPAATGISAA